MALETIEGGFTATTNSKTGAYVLGVGSLVLTLLCLGLFGYIPFEPLVSLLVTVIVGVLGSIKDWSQPGPSGDVPPGAGVTCEPKGPVTGPSPVVANTIERMEVHNYYYAAVPVMEQQSSVDGDAGQ